MLADVLAELYLSLTHRVTERIPAESCAFESVITPFAVE
jgi:hypothetical protein